MRKLDGISGEPRTGPPEAFRGMAFAHSVWANLAFDCVVADCAAVIANRIAGEHNTATRRKCYQDDKRKLVAGIDKPRPASSGANPRSRIAARFGLQNRRTAIRASRVFQFLVSAVEGGADRQVHIVGYTGGDISAPDNKFHPAVGIDQFTSDVPRYSVAIPIHDWFVTNSSWVIRHLFRCRLRPEWPPAWPETWPR